jgi:hypothetical protein
MRKYQLQLAALLVQWRRDWGVSVFPTNPRFGIAMGDVLELQEPSAVLVNFGAKDYVGYCINLAVRLQDYRQGYSFVIHHTVDPDIPGLSRIRAQGMKGVLDEDVFVFPEEAEAGPTGFQTPSSGGAHSSQPPPRTLALPADEDDHEAIKLLRKLVQAKWRKIQLVPAGGGNKYEIVVLDGEVGEGIEIDDAAYLPEDLDKLVARKYLNENFGTGHSIYTLTRLGDRRAQQAKNQFLEQPTVVEVIGFLNEWKITAQRSNSGRELYDNYGMTLPRFANPSGKIGSLLGERDAKRFADAQNKLVSLNRDAFITDVFLSESKDRLVGAIDECIRAIENAA